MSLFRELLISKKLESKPATIEKKWVYGITPPPDDAWIQLYPGVYNTYSLPWKKEYGWYDCNKLNPSDSADNPIQDAYMCWAATSSNMMHWWIAQNKKYIDLYGDRYKGPDYNYPLDKPQESDIFQLYIDSFENEAGKSDDGVNWFIHGKIPTVPSLTNPNATAGFFKDVFPEGVLLGKNYGGMGKETFNSVIKDALDNKKAIGTSIGKVTLSHLVSIWGAEFDEDGVISHVYLADNNDRDQYELAGVGCTRFEVTYEKMPEGGTMAYYKTGYIEQDGLIPFNRLVTLELGEQYWEEYFKNNA